MDNKHNANLSDSAALILDVNAYVDSAHLSHYRQTDGTEKLLCRLKELDSNEPFYHKEIYGNYPKDDVLKQGCSYVKY